MRSAAPHASPGVAASGAEQEERRGLPALVRLALLAGGLIAAGLLLRLPHAADTATMDRWIAGHGAWGAALFVLAGAAFSGAGLPRQAVAFAGGYAFGAAGGLALAMVAQLAGCVAAFAWARALGGDVLARRAGPRLSQLRTLIAARPFSATLTLRLLPVGNNLLLNLLAGVSGIAALPFLAASSLGYVPQTIVFSLLGSGTQVGRATELAMGAALFAASALLGVWLLRRTQS